MAISAGSKALLSDLSGLYNDFNTFIQAFGGTITTLTMPSGEHPVIHATDINNINTKITNFS